jgi:U3 small nucleolar RNA-associated protein 13
MATKFNMQTTFSPVKTIQPIFTGGDVALEGSGRLFATCVEDAVLLLNLDTGEPLARIEGVGSNKTAPALFMQV